MNITDIPEAVARLARQVEHQPSVVRVWALASFASALHLEAIATAATDPAEAVVEVGEMWADQVAQALEDHPERRADTLRAARAVIARLLAGAEQAGVVSPAAHYGASTGRDPGYSSRSSATSQPAPFLLRS